MKNFLGKLKTKLKNKKIMVISLSTFVLIIVVAVAIVNYSFGFKVSNAANESETFPENYHLAKSECVGIDNTEIDNSLEYDGQAVTFDPTKTVSCKLEFEVPGSTLLLYDPSNSNAHSTLGEECHNVQCALDRLYILYKDNKGE